MNIGTVLSPLVSLLSPPCIQFIFYICTSSEPQLVTFLLVIREEP